MRTPPQPVEEPVPEDDFAAARRARKEREAVRKSVERQVAQQQIAQIAGPDLVD